MDKLDLPPIYQNLNVNWFTCILTVSLYSQGIRKLLLKQAKNWKKSNRFLMILKNILKNYKNPVKLKEIYKKFNPTILLLEMIKDFNIKTLKDIFKLTLKKDIYDLKLSTDFIIDFFIMLKINFADLNILVDDKKQVNYYLNLQHILLNNYNKNTDSFDVILDENQDNIKEIREKNKTIRKNLPDVLVLFDSEFNNHIKKNILKHKNKIGDFKLSNSAVTVSDDFKEITFHSSKYKLEAYIDGMGEQSRHVAGIKHNDNFYISHPIVDKEKNHCPIIKYDWSKINFEKDICIDENCEIVEKDDEIPQERCFKMSENDDTILIYTKVKYEPGFLYGFKNKELKSKSASISELETINFEKLSDFDIITELHDIDNLTMEELIEKIKQIDTSFQPLKLSKLELKLILLNRLKTEIYNYPNRKKQELKVKSILQRFSPSRINAKKAIEEKNRKILLEIFKKIKKTQSYNKFYNSFIILLHHFVRHKLNNDRRLATMNFKDCIDYILRENLFDEFYNIVMKPSSEVNTGDYSLTDKKYDEYKDKPLSELIAKLPNLPGNNYETATLKDIIDIIIEIEKDKLQNLKDYKPSAPPLEDIENLQVVPYKPPNFKKYEPSAPLLKAIENADKKKSLELENDNIKKKYDINSAPGIMMNQPINIKKPKSPENRALTVTKKSNQVVKPPTPLVVKPPTPLVVKQPTPLVVKQPTPEVKEPNKKMKIRLPIGIDPNDYIYYKKEGIYLAAKKIYEKDKDFFNKYQIIAFSGAKKPNLIINIDKTSSDTLKTLTKDKLIDYILKLDNTKSYSKLKPLDKDDLIKEFKRIAANNPNPQQFEDKSY